MSYADDRGAWGRLGLLLSVCLLTGCATPGPYHAYEGTQRQTSELALVVCTARTNAFTSMGQKKKFVESAAITHVDGKAVSSSGKQAGSVYILPGQHTLRCNSSVGNADPAYMGALPDLLSVVEKNSTAREYDDLVLNAAAGAQYELRFLRTSRYGKESAVFWILDSRGAVVAGVSPYETNATRSADEESAVDGQEASPGEGGNDLGSTSSPSFLPQLPADSAVVCIFRKKRMVSASVSFELTENGANILSIGNGRYGHFLAKPGRHIYSSNLGVYLSATTFDLNPGRIYYAEADINGKLTAVEEPAALDAIQKLKQIK